MKFSEMSKKDKALNLMYKPFRKCLSIHYCCICDDTIFYGQYYYDGGYGKRAHEMCVKDNLPMPESLSV